MTRPLTIAALACVTCSLATIVTGHHWWWLATIFAATRMFWVLLAETAAPPELDDWRFPHADNRDLR